MTASPAAQAWLWFAVVAAFYALILFLGAGTLDYWRAWLFLAVVFGAMAAVTWDLVRRDPALLRRRIKGGAWAEERPVQRIVMAIAMLGYIALLMVPALDVRWRGASVPAFVSVMGDVAIAAGFYCVFLVFRANSFAASTIEVGEGQHVISTGPYAVVRHPMYAGGLLYMAATPLALGSWWGLVPFVAILAVILWRLIDEERLLVDRLPGYAAYCAKTKWRLLPGVF
jgi:protein-S-isoprenylcysteine O-methyltransferase Ste14